MNGPVGIAALLGLALLTACTNDTMSKSAIDEAAAGDACRAEADAAKDQPEGRGLTGATDYNRFVEECLRSKGY
ncbi:MAG: hypothetical protein ACM3N5_08070 [Candidatus Eiseniibacteriota bacterium]